MRNFYFLLLISFSSFASACDHFFTSEFDGPQSMRYRIDNIMSYSDPDGNVCFKRASSKGATTYVDILHPYDLNLFYSFAVSNDVLLSNEFKLSYDFIAIQLICRSLCENIDVEKLKLNPSFKDLVSEVQAIINNHKPIYPFLSDDFVAQANLMLDYFTMNETHE